MPHVGDVAVKKEKHAPREGAALPRISWRTPEFVYYEKSPDWYWALAIVTLALMAVAILQRDFLFGVLIVISSFAVLLYSVRRPKTVTIILSGAGVQIDDRLFSYDTLKSFWIFYRLGEEKELSVHSDRVVAPHIKIPLGPTNPNEVREYLLSYLPEQKQEESFIDLLARLMKF